MIVATLGRDKELRLLFDSLREQTFKDFEVIVVDQNEEDFIADIVKDYANSLTINQIRTRSRGASAARNRGLESARGEIVTCPDDDCEYAPDILERVLKLFRENSSWTGLIASSSDKDNHGAVSRLATEQGLITKFNILNRAIEFGIFVRASAIKDFFFDEDLGVGSKSPWWSDEGPDFVYRLIQKGAVFIYIPSIVIFHPNPTLVYNEKTLTRSWRYGLGRGRYLKKHRYPFWFVLYVWSLYVAGIMIGIAQLNRGKIAYYYHGLKGRIKGYLSK